MICFSSWRDRDTGLPTPRRSRKSARPCDQPRVLAIVHQHQQLGRLSASLGETDIRTPDIVPTRSTMPTVDIFPREIAASYRPKLVTSGIGKAAYRGGA